MTTEVSQAITEIRKKYFDRLKNIEILEHNDYNPTTESLTSMKITLNSFLVDLNRIEWRYQVELVQSTGLRNNIKKRSRKILGEIK